MIERLISFEILVQIIGFVAVGFSFAIFQVNNRKKMLMIMICAGLLYTVHFFLLGAFTGAAINLVGVFRNYAFHRLKPHKHSWLMPGFFILLFIIVSIWTWQGFISLLPLGGAVSGTIAFWQTNTKHIRRLALIASPLWFTYNLISGSYPGMIVEIVMLTSNLIGMFRFDFRPAKSAEVPITVK